MCQQPAYRVALTAALPQLQKLDGQQVNTAEAMQYLATLHLQAFQPMQPPQQPQLLLTEAAVDAPSVAGSPVRCLGPARCNSVTPPQPAVVSHGRAAPLSVQVQQAMAAVRSPISCASPNHAAAGGVCREHHEPYFHQQQHDSCREADAEWQLAQLLEECPQLVQSLMKALRPAETELAGAAAGGLGSPGQRELPVPSGLAAAEHACQPGSQPAAIAAEVVVAAPHPCASASTQTEADGRLVEQLQAKVASLRDEVEALNAELEVQGQAAAQRQREAAAAIGSAATQAEQQVLAAQQAADAAVQQAQQELDTMQVRLEVMWLLPIIYVAMCAALIHGCHVALDRGAAKRWKLL